MLVQVDLSMANEMKPDIWQMDRCLAELKELEKRLAVQSQQLSGAGKGQRLFDNRAGPNFIKLSKQKILLKHFLLSINWQDTSHKLYI